MGDRGEAAEESMAGDIRQFYGGPAPVDELTAALFPQEPPQPPSARLRLADGTELVLVARLFGREPGGVWQWRLSGPASLGRIEIVLPYSVSVSLPPFTVARLELDRGGGGRVLLPDDTGNLAGDPARPVP